MLHFLLLGLFALNPAHAETLATVGSKKITVKEFQRRYKETEVAYNRPEPSVFLEDLIRYEMGVQEAKKQGLRKSPIIQERIDQELYKLLIERAIGKQVNNIKVSEKEMRQEYKRSPEIRTSHILIELKQDATPKQLAAAQRRANEIYAEVAKSKRSFEELVKLYSDDSLSKPAGGDIGYQTRVSALPEYYNTALRMRVGQVSKPVRSKYGFHILKKTGQRSFQQADRRQLRAIVFERKRKALFDRYFARLKNKYKSSVNAAALKKVQ